MYYVESIDTFQPFSSLHRLVFIITKDFKDPPLPYIWLRHHYVYHIFYNRSFKYLLSSWLWFFYIGIIGTLIRYISQINKLHITISPLFLHIWQISICFIVYQWFSLSFYVIVGPISYIYLGILNTSNLISYYI